MSQTVAQRLTRNCGACLSLLLVAAILVPGCAGKRSELFSSLITPKAASSDSDKDVAEEPKAEDASRIAGTDKAASEAQLSAFTDSEIIDGPPGLMQRLRNRFGRHQDEMVTTDPFIESEAPKAEAKKVEKPAQAPIADQVDPSVEELLASFESKMPERQSPPANPWWEKEQPATRSGKAAKAAELTTNQNDEFDSRLESLRAQLAGTDTETTAENAATSTDKLNPFADEAAALAENKSAETQAVASNNHLLTQPAEELLRTAAVEPQSPSTLDANWAGTPAAEVPQSEARQRIDSMVADARRDWENWNLRRAYRTALDAQELAVLENVQFRDDEERPQQLAEQIAADLRGEAIQTVAAKSPSASEVDVFNPFGDEMESVATEPQSDLGFPAFQDTAGLWTSSPSKSTAQDKAIEICEADPSSRSTTSGVSLLPPSDDFPSDAAGSDWTPMLSPLTTTGSTDSEDVQLTMHRSPGFTLSRETKPKEQLSGLSASDNQALLSTAADQRNRVFDSKSAEWPSLSPKGVEADRETGSREPIRIAKGPRFSLDEVPAEIPAASSPKGKKAAGNGSLLGQFWRSQPIWLIGGILLLVIALRLMPWPRRDAESSGDVTTYRS